MPTIEKPSDMQQDHEGELLSDAFMIRFWLEDTAQNNKATPWHGQITHVSSGESRYIKDLHGLLDYAVHFLKSMGARIGWDWRIRSWLTQGRSMMTRNKVKDE